MSATSLVQGHDNRSPQQQYRCAISKGAILPLSSTGEALAKSQNYRLDVQMRLIEHCGYTNFSPKQRKLFGIEVSPFTFRQIEVDQGQVTDGRTMQAHTMVSRRSEHAFYLMVFTLLKYYL